MTAPPAVPPHVAGPLVRHVDVIADPEVVADPYGYFDRLREQGPVLYSSALGGFWMVLGAEEVREAYGRDDVFSSYPTGIPPMTGFWPRKLNPQELDGDEHRRYRRLLSPFFSPGVIRPLAESVERRAATLIRGFADLDEIDFVDAYAKQLPTEVFLELFGLPVERRATFVTWTWDLLHSQDARRRELVGGEIVGALVTLIARRREEPSDDLISALLRSEIEGDPLSDEELLDMCFLLFIAGLDTVTSQLSVLFHHLARHPEQQQALRADPGRIRPGLEELLRAYPIVPPARTVIRDHELAGATLRAGDTVMLCSSAASRDPRVVVDGSQVRLDRGNGFTTAFGLGPHRCLGSHLARHELEISLRLMLSLAPPFELVPGTTLTMQTAGNVWGFERLPLRFR